jgi:hypothetical protein
VCTYHIIWAILPLLCVCVCFLRCPFSVIYRYYCLQYTCKTCLGCCSRTRSLLLLLQYWLLGYYDYGVKFKGTVLGRRVPWDCALQGNIMNKRIAHSLSNNRLWATVAKGDDFPLPYEIADDNLIQYVAWLPGSLMKRYSS